MLATVVISRKRNSFRCVQDPQKSARGSTLSKILHKARAQLIGRRNWNSRPHKIEQVLQWRKRHTKNSNKSKRDEQACATVNSCLKSNWFTGLKQGIGSLPKWELRITQGCPNYNAWSSTPPDDRNRHQQPR